MSRWAVGRAEGGGKNFVPTVILFGIYLKTVRCRKLIFGRILVEGLSVQRHCVTLI